VIYVTKQKRIIIQFDYSKPDTNQNLYTGVITYKSGITKNQQGCYSALVFILTASFDIVDSKQ